MSSGANAVAGSHSPEGEDGEFEVTAEMLLHGEMDDESTLQEEDATQTRQEVEQEVSDLQKEGDMPLEQLLALYGYKGAASVTSEGGEGGEGGEEERGEKVIAKGDGLNCDQAEDVCINVVVDTGESVLLSPESAETSQTGYSELLQPIKTGQTDQVDLTSKSPPDKTSQSPTSTPPPPPPPSDSSSINVQPHLTSFKGEDSMCNAATTTQDFTLPPPPLLTRNDIIITQQLHSSSTSEGHHLHGAGHHGEGFGQSSKDKPWHSAILNNTMLSCDESVRLQPGDGIIIRQDQPTSSSTALLPHQNHPLTAHKEEDEEEEEEDEEEEEKEGEEGGGTKPSWLRPEFPERRSQRLRTSEMTRSSVDAYDYFASLLEDGSESDEEYCPNEPSWKKEIKVGPAYQADIPDCSPPSIEEAAAVPGASGGGGGDTLVWSLREMEEEQVVKYLDVAAQQVGVATNRNPGSDNEQALEVLYRCKQDSKLALKEILKNGLSKGMEPWSEEECRSFENGLRSVGKDFFQLRKQVPSRSVKEIVEFYYVWKKSERYDMFVQQFGKIGKRKIVYPPGHFSDFMERYFDAYDTDTGDLHYGMTTVYSEVKREGAQHSI